MTQEMSERFNDFGVTIYGIDFADAYIRGSFFSGIYAKVDFKFEVCQHHDYCSSIQEIFSYFEENKPELYTSCRGNYVDFSNHTDPLQSIFEQSTMSIPMSLSRDTKIEY